MLLNFKMWEVYVKYFKYLKTCILKLIIFQIANGLEAV